MKMRERLKTRTLSFRQRKTTLILLRCSPWITLSTSPTSSTRSGKIMPRALSSLLPLLKARSLLPLRTSWRTMRTSRMTMGTIQMTMFVRRSPHRKPSLAPPWKGESFKSNMTRRRSNERNNDVDRDIIIRRLEALQHQLPRPRPREPTHQRGPLLDKDPKALDPTLCPCPYPCPCPCPCLCLCSCPQGSCSWMEEQSSSPPIICLETLFQGHPQDWKGHLHALH